MTVNAEATAVVSRLVKLETGQAGLAEAQNLAELRDELSERAARVRALGLRIRLLREERVPLPSLPDVSRALQSVLDVSARFAERPNVSELKRGKRWTNLLGALDTAISNVNSAVGEDWRTFHRDQLFGGSTPDQLKARLPQTPKNKESLGQYSALYVKFAVQRNVPPDTREGIQQLRQWSAQLQTLAGTFQEDVPVEVARFYAATASMSGAPLALLTPTVADWLRANDQLDAYVVRARVS